MVAAKAVVTVALDGFVPVTRKVEGPTRSHPERIWITGTEFAIAKKQDLTHGFNIRSASSLGTVQDFLSTRHVVD